MLCGLWLVCEWTVDALLMLCSFSADVLCSVDSLVVLFFTTGGEIPKAF